MIAPQSSLLPDGKRLHLQHGPIDLVIEAFGDDVEVKLAYGQAVARFQTILNELVAELPSLRQNFDEGRSFKSSVAKTMQQAIKPFGGIFRTPMAAVAGAIADHILAALMDGRQIDKAYVNNGGDIALFLNPKARFDVGIVSSLTPPKLAGKITIADNDNISGIATSGRHGRSLSLGIADAVTVLAKTAAEADIAATLIANHVKLSNHPAIKRLPAIQLDPDNDLGECLVTVDVGALNINDVKLALADGQRYGEKLLKQGLIKAASLCLNNEIRLIGDKKLNTSDTKRELLHA